MYDVLRVRTARRTEMLSLLAGSIPSRREDEARRDVLYRRGNDRSPYATINIIEMYNYLESDD